VDREVDRSKGGFDLGPGVEIRYPPQQPPATGEDGNSAVATAAAAAGSSSSAPGQGLDIPNSCSVFDLLFDPLTASWCPWLATAVTAAGGDDDGEEGAGGPSGVTSGVAGGSPGGPAPVPHESLAFNEIVVPTVDSVRYGFLLQLLAGHNKHVSLVVGGWDL